MVDETTNTLGNHQIDTRGRIRTAHTANPSGMSLRLRRTWHTDPPPDGEPPPPTPPTPPAPKPNPPTPPPADDAPTHTQKQLDAIISNEKKLAGAASLTALAKKLGFETAEEMEAAAKEAKEKKDGEKSDLQKAQDANAKLIADLAAEKQSRLDLETALTASKVDDRIKHFAREAKAAKPDNVVKWLRLEKKTEVEKLLREDGTIDDKATEKLITEFKKEEPSWFAVMGHGSPSNRDGTPLMPGAKELERASFKNQQRIRG